MKGRKGTSRVAGLLLAGVAVSPARAGDDLQRAAYYGQSGIEWGASCQGCWAGDSAVVVAVRASSMLVEGPRVYGPELLLDRRPETAWCEGVAGDGEGQWVELLYDHPTEPGLLGVLGGYFKDWRRLGDNGRVARLRVDYDGRTVARTELVDLASPEDFAAWLRARLAEQPDNPYLEADLERLQRDPGAYLRRAAEEPPEVQPWGRVEPPYAQAVRLVIESVHPGRRYHDTCISTVAEGNVDPWALGDAGAPSPWEGRDPSLSFVVWEEGAAASFTPALRTEARGAVASVVFQPARGEAGPSDQEGIEALLDGDPSTRWCIPLEQARGGSLVYRFARPRRFAGLEIQGGDHASAEALGSHVRLRRLSVLLPGLPEASIGLADPAADGVPPGDRFALLDSRPAGAVARLDGVDPYGETASPAVLRVRLDAFYEQVHDGGASRRAGGKDTLCLSTLRPVGFDRPAH